MRPNTLAEATTRIKQGEPLEKALSARLDEEVHDDADADDEDGHIGPRPRRVVVLERDH